MDDERLDSGRGAAGEWRWAAAETALVFLLFFLAAGWPAPDTNEAHYVSRAKRCWNPDWRPGDFFLDTPDAHLPFSWAFGWPSRWASLETTAWLGRLACWALAAAGLRWLAAAVTPGRGRAVLTAALYLVLQNRFQMAGEWVIGGLEGKSAAYGFVLFALGALVRGRWNATWVLLGAASAFHVLVGGWSVVAAGAAWLFAGTDRPPLRRMVPALAGGLLLALPGLLPALQLTWGVDRTLAQEAAIIHVFRRLSHHLLLHTFDPAHVARHAALAAVWLAAAWPSCGAARRLHRFVLGAVLIAVVGAAIDVATLQRPVLAASLLRYYWFRLSDAMLPLGAAVAAVWCAEELRRRRRAWGDGAIGLLALAAAAALVPPWLGRWPDPLPRAFLQPRGVRPEHARRLRAEFDAWLAACQWAARHTRPDARFITPRRQQTFGWYAERPVVVCWKDVPQDARGVVAWWRRMQELYPPDTARRGLAALGETRLIELARNYGATYIMIDRARSARRLRLPRVYPVGGHWNAYYEIYWVPPAASDAASDRRQPAPDAALPGRS